MYIPASVLSVLLMVIFASVMSVFISWCSWKVKAMIALLVVGLGGSIGLSYAAMILPETQAFWQVWLLIGSIIFGVMVFIGLIMSVASLIEWFTD